MEAETPFKNPHWVSEYNLATLNAVLSALILDAGIKIVGKFYSIHPVQVITIITSFEIPHNTIFLFTLNKKWYYNIESRYRLKQGAK